MNELYCVKWKRKRQERPWVTLILSSKWQWTSSNCPLKDMLDNFLCQTTDPRQKARPRTIWLNSAPLPHRVPPRVHVLVVRIWNSLQWLWIFQNTVQSPQRQNNIIFVFFIVQPRYKHLRFTSVYNLSLLYSLTLYCKIECFEDSVLRKECLNTWKLQWTSLIGPMVTAMVQFEIESSSDLQCTVLG